jgi:hypothetical protein
MVYRDHRFPIVSIHLTRHPLYVALLRALNVSVFVPDVIPVVALQQDPLRLKVPLWSPENVKVGVWLVVLVIDQFVIVGPVLSIVNVAPVELPALSITKNVYIHSPVIIVPLA